MKPKKVIQTIVSPFQKFINLEASGGLLLLFVTIIAMAWANSPWADTYFHIWETKITLIVGGTEISNSLVHWINDGLMVIFFFVVGCEIKRELIEGELSTFRKAALPFFAAFGGMAVPVAIFLLLNQNDAAVKGWGIPMATDIAFSLGILALLGNRINLGMNVFLTAFAIIDDIGAVLVIAIFYSQDIQWHPVLIAGILLGVLLIFNYLGVKNLWMYSVVIIFIWYYFLQSGVHPTIAGVLSAFCIPAKNKIRLEVFTENVQDRIRRIRKRWEGESSGRFLPKKDINTIKDIQRDTLKVQPPLQRMEEDLNEFAIYFVMPVFAFANAGVSIFNGGSGLLTNLTFSIAAGLFLGKAIGIFSFSWLSTILGIADLPEGTNWTQIFGLALFGGIGFTMSLFIANLAFEPGGLLDQAKMGVLFGSVLSALLGYLILYQSTQEKGIGEEQQQEQEA